jgi:hypothetical protein
MRPQGSGGLAGAISRAAQAGLDWFESGGHPNRLYRPNEPLYHGPDWRETQGLVPGWATRAYNAVFHDPYIHYGAENDFALRGVPQGPSWANVYAQMNQGLGPHNLDPVRLGILRGLLAGAAAGGINADRLAPNDPVAQMVALRGLNPQDIRLGG